MDVMKGLAILLVVLGHAIQKNIPSFQMNYLFSFIYSFHMPLFFVVSGYLMYLTLQSNRLKWAQNKAFYLLVPHVVFNVLYYFACRTGLTIFDNVTLTDSLFQWLKASLFVNSGEWFLWVLFCCFMLLLIIKSVEMKFPQPAFLAFVTLFTALFLFLPNIETDYIRIYEIQWYYIFALSGFLLAKYRVLIPKYFAFIIVAVICYPIFMYSLSWNLGKVLFPLHTYYGYLESQLSSTYFMRYLQALTGMCIVLLVSITINKLPKLAVSFVWLGRMTLGVYLFHMFFSGLHIGSGYMAVASAFIFSLSLGVDLTLLCDRIPLLKNMGIRSSS